MTDETNQLPPEYSPVIIWAKLQELERRVSVSEDKLIRICETNRQNIEKLWDHLHKTKEENMSALNDHRQETTSTFGELKTALASRLPWWAVALIGALCALIGHLAK